MSRRIHSADALLRQYAEAKSLLSAPRAQNLIAHSGGIAAKSCADPKCSGAPRRIQLEGIWQWRCTGCRKPWPIEEKDLLRNEFKDTKRGVRSIGTLRIRLGDFAVILKKVSDKMPAAFLAWSVHVLAPTYKDERDVEIGLGVPLDLVPERLERLVSERRIDPLPQAATLYRVKRWVSEARQETMNLVWKAGL